MPKSQRRDGPTDVKTFPAKIIGVDEKEGIVEAIVAVIGNIDAGDDIIHSGAFTKTIVEHSRRVRVLDQHKTDSVLRVVGKPLEIREVGREELPPELLAEHPEATGGLYTKTQYLIKTPEGLGVFHRIDQDAINEYSIGYSVLDADHSRVEVDGKKIPVRNIRTVKLWEYSPVIWGMNEATTTVSAKGAEAGEDKEYTADGPQRRVGDVIISRVHGPLVRHLSDFLGCGVISADEYLELVNMANDVLATLQAGISEDVALRPLETSYWDLMWLSGDDPDEEKRRQPPPPTPPRTQVGELETEVDSQKAGPDSEPPTGEDTAKDADVPRKNVEQELELALTELELLELSG
jgi:phage head maturation protease